MEGDKVGDCRGGCVVWLLGKRGISTLKLATPAELINQFFCFHEHAKRSRLSKINHQKHQFIPAWRHRIQSLAKGVVSFDFLHALYVSIVQMLLL